MSIEVVLLFLMLTSSTTTSYFIPPRNYNRQYQFKPPAAPRLILQEWPSYNIQDPYGPGTYSYGYEVDDPSTGNKQFKNEEKFFNNTVKGSYGLLRPDGMISITNYVSDVNGYRSSVEQRLVPPYAQHAYETHIRPSSNYPVTLPSYTGEEIFLPKISSAGRHRFVTKPQQQIPQQYQSNFPLESTALKSPISRLANQPVISENGNEFLFQNSKLNNFFTSPYYFDNINNENLGLKQNVNDDDEYDTIEVQDSVIPGLSNPLTKESIWYKEFINTKYRQ